MKSTTLIVFAFALLVAGTGAVTMRQRAQVLQSARVVQSAVAPALLELVCKPDVVYDPAVHGALPANPMGIPFPTFSPKATDEERDLAAIDTAAAAADDAALTAAQDDLKNLPRGLINIKPNMLSASSSTAGYEASLGALYWDGSGEQYQGSYYDWAFRSNQNKGWSPSIVDKQQWLQVDLGSVQRVMGLKSTGFTRQGVQQCVQSYSVQYSSDASTWSSLPEAPACNAADPFAEPIRDVDFPARYVRFVPQTWVSQQNGLGMRVGVLTARSEFALNPSMMNGFYCYGYIPGTTNYLPNPECPNQAMYGGGNGIVNTNTGSGKWYSYYGSEGGSKGHLQINLGSPMRVRGIQTQGAAQDQQWVSAYIVQYTNYCDTFPGGTIVPAGDTNGYQYAQFSGNSNNGTIVTNDVDFVARCIRIWPKSRGGTGNNFAMRVGVLVDPVHAAGQATPQADALRARIPALTASRDAKKASADRHTAKANQYAATAGASTWAFYKDVDSNDLVYIPNADGTASWNTMYADLQYFSNFGDFAFSKDWCDRNAECIAFNQEGRYKKALRAFSEPSIQRGWYRWNATLPRGGYTPTSMNWDYPINNGVRGLFVKMAKSPLPVVVPLPRPVPFQNGKYHYFKDWDYTDNYITQLGDGSSGDMNSLANACNNNANCVGFSSWGYLKDAVKPYLVRWSNVNPFGWRKWTGTDPTWTSKGPAAVRGMYIKAALSEAALKAAYADSNPAPGPCTTTL